MLLRFGTLMASTIHGLAMFIRLCMEPEMK